MKRVAYGLRGGALGLMLITCTSCATRSPNIICGGISGPPSDGVVVVLTPGDELDIKFYYAPELNERQVIRPDGMITLQLVGDVKAAGLTPDVLEEQLEEMFKELVDRNDVTVIVRGFYGRAVYVGGAVVRPRAVEMPGNLTVMAAVVQAGGFDYTTASIKQVLVMRQEAGQYKLFEVNLEDRLEGKDLSAFYLHPRDVVYVSRSRISDANKWMEQYVNRMVPKVGFSIYKPVGSAIVGFDTSN